MKIKTGSKDWLVKEKDEVITVARVQLKGDSLTLLNGKIFKDGGKILKKDCKKEEFKRLEELGFIVK